MNAPNVKPRKPLRIWPGVVAAALLVFLRFVLPVVAPEAEFEGVDTALIAVFAGMALGAVILLWWLFASRVSWADRLIGLGVMTVAIVAIRPLTHISIQGGMMGLMFFIYALPVSLSLALVAWAVLARRLSPGAQRMTMVAAIVLGCGVWTLARTNGVFGGVSDLEWRWTPTAEERLLAQAANEPAVVSPASPAAPGPSAPASAAPQPPTDEAPAAATVPATGAPAPGTETPASPLDAETPRRRVEWDGFRGPNRDGVVRGVRINPDWTAAAPVEIWRRPIGPGWSSFAVAGDVIFTQEQRGDDEIVSAYNFETGEPVWRHRDGVRFYESNGGAGPRGTPALSHGRVFSLGATGILNALNAISGGVLWSRNAATDMNKAVPDWGVSSSPLVVNDVVIVAIDGQLGAYDASTGALRWMGASGGGGYSSPHFATIGGVPQVLLMRGARTISVNPADGTVLWEHTAGPPAVSIVQPALMPDGVLVASASAMGGTSIRRVAVTREAAGWKIEERWESRGLKPYFNDFVVHKGHAFGFDGNILSAINLEDGERKWKGGRYGNGQLILLPDQDLLLVLSEDGELALVSATADKFTEVARMAAPALHAKTWNHPVLVGDVLLVRNGEEMVAFRMSATGPAAGR
ncbi:MAG TPA: PQQ-binding-like beta-propeller repeat protein [Vicinamibacterales bacterium]|nr:PQQ-binding-like beta-propeller repeat protein [Vicinamibacterales bacterium]